MIRFRDEVMLKDESEIKFKSNSDIIHFRHLKEMNVISNNTIYQVSDKVLIKNQKIYSYYLIRITNNNNNIVDYYPMTWFRKADSHKRIKRNNKIDTILND